MRLGTIYASILPSFLGKLGFVLGLQFSLVLFAGHYLFQGFDAEGCIHGLGQPSPPHSMSAPKSPVQSRCKPKVLIEIMLQISYNLRSKAGKAVREFENCKKRSLFPMEMDKKFM